MARPFFDRFQRSARRGLARRLLVWFALFALVPLMTVVWVASWQAESAIRQEVVNGLVAMTNAKATQIESYVEERKRNVTTLAQMPDIVRAVEELAQTFQKGLDSKEYKALDARLRPFLTFYVQSAGYSDLFLISAHGDSLFSVARGEDLGSNYVTGPYRDSELAKVFERAKTAQETKISDFGYYQATNEPAAFIAAPIFKGQTVVAVVALQVNNAEVYRLLADYTGLGKTGETVAVALDSDKTQAVFMAPLRHDPVAAFRRRIKLGSEEAPFIQEAARGNAQSGLTEDYRGREVLAAGRYLPSLRWGMVSKIDTEEAFAGVRRMRQVAFLIGFFSLVGVLLLGASVARSISQPVVKLTAMTQEIAAGKLDHRVEVASQDELGELASAFNKMTADLKGTLVSRDSLAQEIRNREKIHDTLKEVVVRLSATSEGISSAAGQQLGGAQQQASAVGETVATVAEVSRTAEQAAERARKVAESVRKSDEVGKAGRKAVDDSLAVLNTAKLASDAAAEHIIALAEQTQAIGEIIATVSELAEQTNLLSLNAAIEASRAGEHGKGFTVVAAEVKALAEQSKGSTVQIRKMLELIQKATRGAVFSTEESIKSMTRAMSASNEAGETIKLLTGIIAETAESSAQIVASAGQQASGMGQISQAMAHINQVSTQNVEATSRTEQAAAEINTLGRRLSGLLDGTQA